MTTAAGTEPEQFKMQLINMSSINKKDVYDLFTKNIKPLLKSNQEIIEYEIFIICILNKKGFRGV